MTNILLRSDAKAVIKSIFPDVNAATKDKIVEHIILKLNSFNNSANRESVKIFWDMLKAIFPVVNNKESVIQYILSCLKSTHLWIKNGALEALPIIFPHASEPNKESILKLLFVWVDLHGQIDINIMRVIALIILKVEDKNLYIKNYLIK